MSGWAIVAVVAIVVWGIVQLAKARAGIITDESGNESYIGKDDTSSRGEVEETRQEMKMLRDRLHVLERIATENNTLDARERARISAEIEALRGPEELQSQSTPTLSADSKGKEQSQ